MGTSQEQTTVTKASRKKMIPAKLGSFFKKTGTSLASLARNKKFLMVVVTLVLMGGSFYAGMKVESGNNKSTNNAGSALNRTSGSNVNGASTRVSKRVNVSGNIVAVDSSQIEVKDNDGTTQKFQITDGTTVMTANAKKTTVSTLKTGDKVLVNGTTGTDGTVSADRIRVQASN